MEKVGKGGTKRYRLSRPYFIHILDTIAGDEEGMKMGAKVPDRSISESKRRQSWSYYSPIHLLTSSMDFLSLIRKPDTSVFDPIGSTCTVGILPSLFGLKT